MKKWNMASSAALKGIKITEIPLEEVISKVKLVDDAYYDVAKVFFR